MACWKIPHLVRWSSQRTKLPFSSGGLPSQPRHGFLAAAGPLALVVAATSHPSQFTWHRKGCVKLPQGMIWLLTFSWWILWGCLQIFFTTRLTMWWYFLRSCFGDTHFCREDICDMFFLALDVNATCAASTPDLMSTKSCAHRMHTSRLNVKGGWTVASLWWGGASKQTTNQLDMGQNLGIHN